MNCIVDTSVWSLALRRNKTVESIEVHKLKTLINKGEKIFLLGIIVQEILQGIRDCGQLKKVRDAISCFPIIEPVFEDYVYAAELFNHCRSKGIQASTIDFLIASICIRNDFFLLSADKDFQNICRHSKLKLL